KSCEELCEKQTLGLNGNAPAIRYGAAGVRAINDQEPKGKMPGAAAKRAGGTGGLAYPDFKNSTLNVALRGTPIVSLSTGCSILCILQHELQHIEDMKDCADKAFARVRSGNETAASMERLGFNS